MIAIIPARKGSKGLPGKNILNLDGKPLISHSISAALESKLITRVIVSTDDETIATISEEFGAEVPFMRPNELASDNAKVIDSYLYTIDRIQADQNVKISSFVALLPTSPLRNATDIDNAIEIFNLQNADSVISVTYPEVPAEWHIKINKRGIIENYIPDKHSLKNRQDFESSYIPNGAIYVFNVDKLRVNRIYYMDNTFPYIMPKNRSIDIDEMFDFNLAKLLIDK